MTKRAKRKIDRRMLTELHSNMMASEWFFESYEITKGCC